MSTRPLSEATEARPRRRGRLGIAIACGVLALAVVATVALITVRVDRVASGAQRSAAAAEEFFAALQSDPAGAEAKLTALEDALADTRADLDAFPMGQIEAIPEYGANVTAVRRVLDIGDELTVDVGPALIDAAAVFDPQTGRLRSLDEIPGGLGGGAASALDAARAGRPALDALCAAADDAARIDTSRLLDDVATPIDDVTASLEQACAWGEEYRGALEAAEQAAGVVDGGRDLLDEIASLPERLLDELGF